MNTIRIFLAHIGVDYDRLDKDLPLACLGGRSVNYAEKLLANEPELCALLEESCPPLKCA